MGDLAYPWWFTLGGLPGRAAVGSDWLTWVLFVLNLAVFAVCLLIARYFFRAAARSLTPAGGQAKRMLGWLCVVGGLSGWGLRCLMVWVPAYLLFVATLLFMVVTGVAFVRHAARLRVVFAGSDAVALAQHTVANVAMRLPDETPAEVRAELVQLCRELEALSTRGGR